MQLSTTSQEVLAQHGINKENFIAKCENTKIEIDEIFSDSLFDKKFFYEPKKSEVTYKDAVLSSLVQSEIKLEDVRFVGLQSHPSVPGTKRFVAVLKDGTDYTKIISSGL